MREGAPVLVPALPVPSQPQVDHKVTHYNSTSNVMTRLSWLTVTEHFLVVTRLADLIVTDLVLFDFQQNVSFLSIKMFKLLILK